MLYVRVPNPTPSRYGLLSSAVTVDEPNPHWRLEGVQYEPLGCEAASTYPPACDPSPPSKSATYGIPLVTIPPFVVYKGVQCSAPSFTDPVLRDRISSELALGESRAVEGVVWEGSGSFPSVNLAGAAVALGTDPLTPTGAFVALESAMASCYGGDAYLHIPRGALAAFAARGYIERDGNRLRTLAGSVVVAGGGYTGTDPDGEATDGVVWAYATGTVFAWRGPVEFTAGDPGEYINRANNDAVLVAERVVAVGWDCCNEPEDDGSTSLIAYGVPVAVDGLTLGS